MFVPTRLSPAHTSPAGSLIASGGRRYWSGSSPRRGFTRLPKTMSEPMWERRYPLQAWATVWPHPCGWPHQHLSEPVRLPRLCKTREGYQNLCQLITRFKMRETTKQEGSAKLADVRNTGVVAYVLRVVMRDRSLGLSCAVESRQAVR
jgi:hypothetical protein